MKRIPSELKEIAARKPLILNKQFYFATEREPEVIISNKLMDESMFYWMTARPVNDYLARAILSHK